MIDFVLQKFSEISVIPGAEYVSRAPEIFVLHRDFAMAPELHKDREEAQASVPDDDFFCAAFEDLRVEQRPWLFSGELQENDAQRDTQLRSRDAAAVSGRGAPIRERVGEVADLSRNIGRRRILPAALLPAGAGRRVGEWS